MIWTRLSALCLSLFFYLQLCFALKQTAYMVNQESVLINMSRLERPVTSSCYVICAVLENIHEMLVKLPFHFLVLATWLRFLHLASLSAHLPALVRSLCSLSLSILLASATHIEFSRKIFNLMMNMVNKQSNCDAC